MHRAVRCRQSCCLTAIRHNHNLFYPPQKCFLFYSSSCYPEVGPPCPWRTRCPYITPKSWVATSAKPSLLLSVYLFYFHLHVVVCQSLKYLGCKITYNFKEELYFQCFRRDVAQQSSENKALRDVNQVLQSGSSACTVVLVGDLDS